MAHLRDNAYYQRYLEGVASGEIVLPEYTTMLGSVVLHYGEVFCRVKDCYKAKKPFSATNNLRSHIRSHKNITVYDGGSGRASQADIDKAVAFYKSLVDHDGDDEDDNDDDKDEDEDGEHGDDGDGENDNDASDDGQAMAELPKIIWRKDGKAPNLTAMRKLCKELGIEFPCKYCKEQGITCIQDVENCLVFDDFDPED
ncbi:hypothetical protein DIZ76_011891 [Coccidioides immitis]|nr:hypothetical protein DIZ76_011891 [Coccidioides immitis]